MKILFLLGNGFDINLSLPTDYQSFYDVYLKEASPSVTVSELKKYLNQERYQTWADLEWGLGQYTTKVKSVEELEEVYIDLSDHLRIYLESLLSKFVPTAAIKDAVIRGLSNPQVFLPDGMKRDLTAFIDPIRKEIDVVSFNYTNTFERLIANANGLIRFPIRITDNITLNSIRHIHMGLSDSDFIMGVNDDTQIQNQVLLNDACRNLLIKPHINQQLQNLVDEECKSLIAQSDLICLFGLSLGKTDLLWWKAIGQKMVFSNSRLIFFVHDSPAETRNNRIIGKRQAFLSLLIERFGIEKIPEDLIRRIYIGYNTRIFKPDR